MQGIDPETFLRDFHAQFPGATTQIMARGTSDAGSSYDLLTNEVPVTTASLTVLDLACGDGYLLDLLRRRAHPQLHLIGVDMSEHELQAARQRLGPDVPLYHERAQQLSFPDATVDVVLCHMALMLMAPLDDVVAELRRILVPNGIFAAIIGASRQPPGPVLTAFATILQDLLQQSGRIPPDLGDPRSHDSVGLQEVFNATSGFTQLTLKDVTLQLDGTPVQVVQFLSHAYTVFALGGVRGAFEERMLAALEHIQDARGRVPFAVGVVKLRCVRSD
jgi:SAM-dependent methyltransferase